MLISCGKNVSIKLCVIWVINRWNMLNQKTVSVKTVNGFKSKLESWRKKDKKGWACLWHEVCWAGQTKT